MVVKENFDKNKLLIGWWVGIDKTNYADLPVGREQVELAEGNCRADLSAEALAKVESVAGNKEAVQGRKLCPSMRL